MSTAKLAYPKDGSTPVALHVAGLVLVAQDQHRPPPRLARAVLCVTMSSRYRYAINRTSKVTKFVCSPVVMKLRNMVQAGPGFMAAHGVEITAITEKDTSQVGIVAEETFPSHGLVGT